AAARKPHRPRPIAIKGRHGAITPRRNLLATRNSVYDRYFVTAARNRSSAYHDNWPEGPRGLKSHPCVAHGNETNALGTSNESSFTWSRSLCLCQTIES